LSEQDEASSKTLELVIVVRVGEGGGRQTVDILQPDLIVRVGFASVENILGELFHGASRDLGSNGGNTPDNRRETHEAINAGGELEKSSDREQGSAEEEGDSDRSNFAQVRESAPPADGEGPPGGVKLKETTGVLHRRIDEL
jgi:hypothetical protein